MAHGDPVSAVNDTVWQAVLKPHPVKSGSLRGLSMWIASGEVAFLAFLLDLPLF